MLLPEYIWLDIGALILGVWTARKSRVKNLRLNRVFASCSIGLLVLSTLQYLAFDVAQEGYGMFEGDSGLGSGLFYFFGGLLAKIVIILAAIRVALK